MKKSILFSILSLFISSSIYTQPNIPDKGPLFIDTTVPRIDITINPDTLDWIYENVYSDTEFHAKFVFDNGNNRDTVDNVGFRLRGNTSRVSKKKSFKVSFNTFTSGGKFYGVEKLNLNGEHNDPSIMRSKLMWDILRKMGIPAPRANHVQVYINGNYYGLYINVEHIDEEFVLNRFGSKKGNLYKCTWPADLDYIGSDPNVYKMESGDDRVYDLITNKEVDDYSDLASFIDILNSTPQDDFVCKLNDLFNTYDYLKVLAADIFCGNWDGYFNKNNFYLYNNPETGRIEYIPYDVDNTFGIDWFDVDWANINLYEWQPGGSQQRPLYDNIVSNPELRDQFTYFTRKLIENTLDIDSLVLSIEARKNRIAPYVFNDPYYPLDYGWTYNDFLRSYTESLGNHVKYGLYPFLNTRASSMNNQLEAGYMKPIIKYIKHYREFGQVVWIEAFSEAEAKPFSLFVIYSENNGEVQEIEMTSIGNGIYAINLLEISEESEIKYQIKAIDAVGQEQISPCQPIVIKATAGDTPLLFINEFMASNNFTFTDEYGNYGDWIEIYNGDDETVFLGDFYLTDNLEWPDKWQMPNIGLDAGSFALFWADGEIALGDNHAGFKLNKEGEAIGIFSSELFVVDTLSFGLQTEDISFGRVIDGSSDFVFFNTSTPGISNQSNTATNTDELVFSESLIVYPNPVSGQTIYLNKKINCKVFNSSGALVYEGGGVKNINISQFSKGLYLIVSESGLRTKFIIQ